MTVRCPKCGESIDSAIESGLCPSCVMRAGVDFLADTHQLRPEPDSFFSLNTLVNSGEVDESDLDADEGQAFGNYQLLEELARGGMGVVYRAKQLSLNRIVALKTLLAGHLASTADLERFRIEAETVGELAHPGIVRVFEAGEQDGIRYLSMDFIEGPSLAARIAEGSFNATDAARMMQLIAEAVAHAHEHGIIHRDLKPGNVLVDPTGQPKVTDFGLAKRVDNESELTQTGQILGTASYMSPEQAAGQAGTVGPQADIYSCGAILYAMLTGRPPFQSASQLETIRQVARDEPVAPSQLAPDIPRDLETICMRCLQKLPDRRYASAADLAADLLRFLEGRPVQARPVGQAERLWRWSQRNPVIARLVAVLSVVVLSSLLAVTILWLRAEDVADQLSLSVGKERAAKEVAENAEKKARASSLDAARRLLQTQMAEIELLIRTPRIGRVERMRRLLAECVQLLDETDANSEQREALRDMALAWVTVPADVTQAGAIEFSRQRYFTAFDSKLTRFARSADKGDVEIGRVDDPNDVITLQRNGPAAGMLRFSPDDRYLVVRYNDARCVLWDLATLQPAMESSIRNYAMEFDRSGQRFAISEQRGKVRIVSLNKPLEPKQADDETSRIISLEGNPDPHRIRFDPVGRRLAVSQGSYIDLYELESGKRLATMKVPGSVKTFQWSPDGKSIAAASSDRNAYLLDVASQSHRHVFYRHANDVVGIGFSPDGRFVATGSWDGTSRLWEVATGQHIASMQGIFEAFSDDGARIATCFEGEAHLWKLVPGTAWRNVYHHDPVSDAPFRVAFSPPGVPSVLLTTGSTGLTIRDPESGQILSEIVTGVTRSALFMPDGRHLLTVGEVGVQRWPLEWNNDTLQIGHPELIHSPGAWHGYGALSADGRTLVVAEHDPHPRRTNKALRIKLTGDAQLDGDNAIRELKAGPSIVEPGISPDAHWACGGAWHGPRLELWDLTTDQRLPDQFPKTSDARGLFSPDGRWLLMSDRTHISLVTAGDWQRQWRRSSPVSRGTIGFTPDSRYAVISADRQKLEFLEVESGQIVSTLAPVDAYFHLTAAFSFDRRYVALTSKSGTSIIWDLQATKQALGGVGIAWDIVADQSPDNITRIRRVERLTD